MGIEMRLHLVDGEGLNQILEMDWNHFISQMESSSLRSLRPAPDSRLGRDFDIDCEAEFLDLADEISGEGTVRNVLSQNDAHNALLKIVEWVSIGHWEAWEGRCFLYIENAIGRELEHVDDMYSYEVWEKVRETMSQASQESVVSSSQSPSGASTPNASKSDLTEALRFMTLRPLRRCGQPSGFQLDCIASKFGLM